MIWIVFAALLTLDAAAVVRLVPPEYRRRYAQYPKGQEYWVAFAIWHSIWLVALIQSFVAPVSLPLTFRLYGLLCFVAGDALLVWARRVNPHFLPTITYVPPAERVQSGPYEFMSHPGYWGMILAATGMMALLGRLWAVIPMLAYVLLISRRIIVEDHILSEDLSL